MEVNIGPYDVERWDVWIKELIAFYSKEFDDKYIVE